MLNKLKEIKEELQNIHVDLAEVEISKMELFQVIDDIQSIMFRLEQDIIDIVNGVQLQEGGNQQ